MKPVRILCFYLILGAQTEAKAETAANLLRQADRLRGAIDTGLEYTVDVNCASVDLNPVKRTYSIRSKGNNILAKAIAPQERLGDLVLVNGRRVWELRSTSKRPVAIAPAERLNGLAAVGDIISTHFADIYDGKVIRQSKIDKEAVVEIELTAKDNATAYRSGRCWISESTGAVVKAEFYSPAKVTLKTVTFDYDHNLQIGKSKSKFVSQSRIIHDDTSGAECNVKFGQPTIVDTRPEEFDIDQLVKAKQ